MQAPDGVNIDWRKKRKASLVETDIPIPSDAGLLSFAPVATGDDLLPYVHRYSFFSSHFSCVLL